MQLNISKEESCSYFNNELWRSTINDFCQKIFEQDGLKIHGICPWGFEVFNNTNFLKKNIRRYFCYFGLENNQENIDYIESSKNLSLDFHQFVKHRHPDWGDNIVCLLSNEHVTKINHDDYECKSDDKLLSFFLKPSQNILNDYCKYAICSLAALKNKTGEVKEYQTSIVFRWRAFQLYLMAETLYAPYSTPLNKVEQRIFKSIVFFTDNQVQPFYSTSESEHEITEFEIFLFDSFIFPRVETIAESIRSEDNRLVTQKCFHTDSELSMNISEDIYNSVFNKIYNTYNNFFI
ncbi:hypothetical protein HQQ94_05155 [Shewanella sp. VB17]|uniref:hypothetical protein n=1 Tax=Shewanella sp. VB17 TaxID=2739432 RepID=UPI00156597B5|nr:hypothetical protein [Shewanella sp. VB17]NRD72643.1 hypothetical protein [Shewanella sp. VB17]